MLAITILFVKFHREWNRSYTHSIESFIGYTLNCTIDFSFVWICSECSGVCMNKVWMGNVNTNNRLLCNTRPIVWTGRGHINTMHTLLATLHCVRMQNQSIIIINDRDVRIIVRVQFMSGPLCICRLSALHLQCSRSGFQKQSAPIH